MAPVFKNVGQVPTANCYHAVILLSMISKVFEKFVNNRPVYHLKKSGLFFYLNYGFRPSQSTADFATALYDRLATPFNRSRTTPVLALDFAKAFDRFFHAGLLNKVKSYRISSQIFGLFYFFSKVGGFE